MQSKFKNELLIVIILSVLLILIISFFQIDVLRIILGLLLVLFFPGYTLIAALFPKKDDLSGIERVALSFGLSIAVVPLIGLILNYTPWGIRLYPVLFSITLFVIIMSTIAILRRSQLPPDNRFAVSINWNISGWMGGGWLNKTLSVLLILSILTAIGTLSYVIAKPKVGEKFTEFYILGLEGKVENYPKEAVLGEEVKVISGIVNWEFEETSYLVEISIDGLKVAEI